MDESVKIAPHKIGPGPLSQRGTLAISLARRGFYLFPLQPGKKLPYRNESWQSLLTSDPDSIAVFFAERPDCNYGVCPGSQFVVIDLDHDPAKGKDGEAEFRELERAQPACDRVLDSSFCVGTPRGGKHLYLRTAHAVSNSSGSLPAGIDVRGCGGYVVGPGCCLEATDDRKITSGEYVIINDVEIRDAPPWLLARLTSLRERQSVAGVTLCEFDRLQAIQRAEELIRRRAPAVEGNGGDAHTYQTALILRDLGVSEEMALELLFKEFPTPSGPQSWNQRCVPPWSEDELAAKVRNAYRYGKEPAGSRSGYLLQQLDKSEDVAGTGHEDRPLSGAELARGNYPAASYVLDRLIVSGLVNLLFGDGGTGKTTLALQIGVAVSSGRPLFNLAVKQMPVLVVLAEDDNGETKRRLMDICKDLGVNLEDLSLRVWARPGLDSTLASVDDVGAWTELEFLNSLRRELSNIGPCLLVLDSVADIATLDENKRLPVNTLCKKVLGQLCRQFGCTVLALGHPSKAAMSDGSGYAGSTAWNNAVRNRLTLEAPRDRPESTRRTLKVGKANYGARHSMELDLFDGVFASVQQADERARAAAIRERVFEFVRDYINDGVCIVRGNGSGVKVESLLGKFTEQYGIRLTKREILAQLDMLIAEGRLIYRLSNKNDRNARAGYALGPRANLPTTH